MTSYQPYFDLSSQPARSGSYEHPHQRGGYHYDLGWLMPTNAMENPAPSSTDKICTSLAVLEHNYRNAQAENIKKEVEIQSLLHNKICNGAFHGDKSQLQEDILNLQEKIFQLSNDIGQLWARFSFDLKSISTLAVPKAVTNTVQPFSATDVNVAEATSSESAQTDDLIDLRDFNEESADIELIAKDTPSLEDYYIYDSESSKEVERSGHNQSLPIPLTRNPSFPELSFPPYILHFVSDKKGNEEPNELQVNTYKKVERFSRKWR